MLDRLLTLLQRAWRGDKQALASAYAESVQVYGILGQIKGREHLAHFLQECLQAFPDPQISLHEAFADASGSRVALRHHIVWQNLGTGFGRAPSNQRGVLSLTSMLKIQGGQITEQVLGFSTFDLPHLLLLDWGLAVPEVRDPTPELLGAVPGDPAVNPADRALAERFVRAFGARDLAALETLYDPDVELYTPLGWPLRGWNTVRNFVEQFHIANPGLRVGLHDYFASADGQKLCWRIRLHFHNTGTFYGNPPTGDQGKMMESHFILLKEGKIRRQIVGDGGLQLPKGELVDWKMAFPRQVTDPDPALPI
ncbi:nuclear transport factor 2 family protein [Ktedonosporobacter rubrisoli]|uniref:Nuclear transport factor 2 family protein n=1 Tax=Ktedonosporobacter rubrisoli TaxID=2509675 RepID=A0A4P6JNK1_KTERU|nr:nuclear transport factor 2 family protein [Ktedonosporobacter rubrisoli]QBD76306.1 nuclear transport factor 2 family protein [Ktedonosporobacter rubrisoli]